MRAAPLLSPAAVQQRERIEKLAPQRTKAATWDQHLNRAVDAAHTKTAMGKKAGGFQALGLDAQLLKGVLGMYAQPTPVQRAVLPAALEGRDVACMARTGAGKTAAFLIPLLQHVTRSRRKDEPPTACVLSPTRELALQTYKFSTKMAKFCVRSRRPSLH